MKLLPAPSDPIPGRRTEPPPDPKLIDGALEYELEAIKDSRILCNKLQYLVAWKGYRYEEHSWVDKREVLAPDLVAEFYQKNPGALWRIHAI